MKKEDARAEAEPPSTVTGGSKHQVFALAHSNVPDGLSIVPYATLMTCLEDGEHLVRS